MSEHGTTIAYQRHWRAGEKPCRPCVDAYNRARQLRELDRLAGRPRLVPLGEPAWQVLNDRPANWLCEELGWRHGRLRRVLESGPTGLVRRRTRARIRALPPAPWSVIGLQRRVRALAALGWSARALAARSDLTVQALSELRMDQPRQFVRVEIAAGVCALYDRLHMTPAPEGRSATRARNAASAAGWEPPLAWDDIDHDPGPVTLQHAPKAEARAADLADLIALGANVTDACRRLGIAKDTLQTWCIRHGHSALYLALAAREGDWNAPGRRDEIYQEGA